MAVLGWEHPHLSKTLDDWEEWMIDTLVVLLVGDEDELIEDDFVGTQNWNCSNFEGA